MAALGSVMMLVLGGLGVGVGAALSTGDSGELLRLTADALAWVPAVWTLLGLAVALFGLAPRATAAAWVALAVVVFVELFGTLLSLPHWLIDVSPFGHVPDLPASSLSAGPLIVLTALAGGLVALGLAGFARRDIAA